MKRPLAAVTVVYAAGLVACDICPISPRVLLPLTLCTAFLTLLGLLQSARGFKGLVSTCVPSTVVAAVSSGLGFRLFPLLFLAGWTNLSCRTTALSPHDLRNLGFETPEIVTLRGTLPETPSQRLYVQDDRESYRSLATLRLTGLRRNKSDWQPAYGTVLVLTPGILQPEFFAGQEVEISGVLAEPPGPAAEGLFDYSAYLRRQSVYYQLKNDGTNDWTLLSHGTHPPFSDRFLAWARATLARGLPSQDEPLQMLWAMTLGWKTVNNEIYEPFMRTGTMHIFAISGLHIALIAGIFVALLRVFQLPRIWCGLVVVPLIWFYTAATGWQPSAIRSTVMMTVIIGGWALSRPTDLINSLAASAFCILLWDPQQLFGASFQLSFFVVLSLALLLPPFERVYNKLLQTDPLLPRDLVPGWKRALLVPARWLAASLAVSLAAWIGSLPLTAYYFHLFSPVTLLANLLVVPLSSCALAANLGSLICGTWLSWATELFNHSAWFWMHLMMRLSQGSARLPGACFNVQSPSLFTISLYYALVIGLLSRALVAPKRRLLIVPAAVAVGIVCLWQWQSARGVATLTILPLSGGFSVHLHHPRLGPDILVDCGRSNAVQFTTKPFLRAKGIDRLPALVLTHGDIRHVGGAELVHALFFAKRVYASPVRARSPTYRYTLEHLRQTQHLVETVSRDSKLGPWTILHPETGDAFTQADDNALVLAATLNGTRVILLSDLGQPGQTALLERFPDLRADILITGLPAASEPVCPALIDRLQPRLIVVADSEFPASERASSKLEERLRTADVPVVYTRFSGTATLELHPGRWQLRSMKGLGLRSTPSPEQPPPAYKEKKRGEGPNQAGPPPR